MLNIYSLKFSYQFIHRMSRSERRYFKRLSKFHGGKKIYMELFDQLSRLSRQNTPRDRALKIIRKKHKRVDLAVKHLNERLLETILIYYESNSPDHKVQKSLRRAEMLLYKGFIRPMPRLLLKIHRRARQEEKFTLALQALHLLKQLWGLNVVSSTQLSPKELFEQERLILKYLDYESRAWYAAALYVEKLLEEGELLSPHAGQLIEQRIAHLNLLPPMPDDPISLHFLYDTYQAVKAYAEGRKEDFLKQTEFLAYKFDQAPDKKRYLQGRYMITLNNLIAAYITNANYQAAWETVNRLRNLRPTSRLLRFQKMRFLIFSELNTALLAEKSDYITEDIDTFLQKIQKTYLHTAPAYAFMSQYLLTLHATKEKLYEKAYAILKNILQAPSKAISQNLRTASYILALMITYQMRNFQQLTKVMQNFYRYLHRLKNLNPTEEIMKKWLYEVLKGEFSTPTSAIEKYKTYQNHLLYKKPDEKRFWETFFPTLDPYKMLT
ncbi:MAG: hypothetical protein ACUVRD_05385 [Bacteroidia bacterium]